MKAAIASEPAIATNSDGPVDFARVGQIAQATGATEILGPPPFDPPGTEARDETSPAT